MRGIGCRSGDYLPSRKKKKKKKTKNKKSAKSVVASEK